MDFVLKLLAHTPNPENDIIKVIDQFARPFLNLDHGPWIAGGAVRKIMLNEDIEKSDIDIFCPNKQVCDWVNMYLSSNKKLINQGSNDFTFAPVDEGGNTKFFKFQVINAPKFFFETVEELIDSFDFTATMFVTDGKTVLYTEEALRDAQNKKMVTHTIRPTGAPLRLLKYAKKGYTPQPGVLAALMGVNNPEFTEKTGLYYDTSSKPY